MSLWGWISWLLWEGSPAAGVKKQCWGAKQEQEADGKEQVSSSSSSLAYSLSLAPAFGRSSHVGCRVPDPASQGQV